MIKMYTASWCGPCISAKRLLDSLGLSYEEIDIEKEGISRLDLKELTGGATVPQIVIKNKPIGGFDSLMSLSQSGKLNKLLDQWNL